MAPLLHHRVAPISVIIPIYNKAPHIERAMASVVAQTVGPEAIIAVDDASTDDSLSRLKAISNPRVHILYRDRPGPGGYAARNLAIRAARTPWVAFLDADDEWTPRHIEALSVAFADRELGGVFAGFRTKRRAGGTQIDPFSADHARPKQLEFDDVLDWWLAKRSCPIWTGAVAFRRDVVLAAGLFPEGRCRRGGDKDLWLRACALTRTLAVPEATAIYHADSVNMVTETTSTAEAHCIWPTIEALLLNATPARATRLKRLYNLQVWERAYKAWRSGILDEESAAHFFQAEEPMRHAAIRLMQATSNPQLARLLNGAASLKRRAQSSGRAELSQ